MYCFAADTLQLNTAVTEKYIKKVRRDFMT